MSENLTKTLFLIAVFIFVFNLFFLNDAVFTDGQTYVNETKVLLEGGELTPIQQMFPLKHYAMKGLFVVTQLPIETYSKLFPLLVTIGCLAFAYLISKNLFEQDYLGSLLIGFGTYWVLNFFALNHIESLVSFFLLSYFYFFYCYEKEKGIDLVNIIGIVLSVGALVFTKIIGLVLAPFLFIFFLLLLVKKKKMCSLLLIIPFVFLIALVLNKNNKSQTVFEMLLIIFNQMTNIFNHSFNTYFIQIGIIVLGLFYFPPNNNLNEVVFGNFLPYIKAFFLILILPLILFGAYLCRILGLSGRLKKRLSFTFQN